MNAPFAFPQFAPAPDDGPMLLPLEEIPSQRRTGSNTDQRQHKHAAYR